MLLLLQKYIKGEGWYAFTYQYHVWLILQFEEKLMLNFFFYLMKSIQKMSQQVQRNVNNPLTSLHHSTLVKILISSKLEQRHDSWVEFLKRNHFETLVSTPKSIRKAPATVIDEVARIEAPKPSSPGITEEALQFIVKYWRKAKNGSAMSIPTSKSRGKKQRIE